MPGNGTLRALGYELVGVSAEVHDMVSLSWAEPDQQSTRRVQLR